MKKTLTINLNGSVFHIDEDAFGRLSSYLNAVDKHFPNAEDKEILRDIEARIAELFSEKLINRSAVEIDDVEEVISILGQPSQFDNDNESTAEPHEKQQESKKTTRKLYRDTDNQVLGGVLSGFAAYFGFDVVWLRIAAVLLVIFGFGMPVPLYIIAWLIMPEAKTAAQKLEMRGEAVTVDSIRNFFESEQFRENANKVGSRLSEILPVLIKVFFVFWGSIAAIVGFSVILSLLAAAVALIFTGSWFVFQAGTILTNSIFWSAVATVVLIPAVGMLVGGIRLIRNRKNPRQMKKHSGIFGGLMLILWVIALLVLIASAIHGSTDFEFSIDENRTYIYENRTVPAFNKIDAANGLEIEIVQADTTFIENSNAEHIIIGVKDSVLYVKPRFNKKCFLQGLTDYDRKLIIHTPGIDKITAQNTCAIYSKMPLKAENFVLDLENACKVQLDIEAKDVKMKCENACRFDMKIKAKNIRFDGENAVKGNFEVETDYLEVETENLSKIGLKGVANRLLTKKGSASNIDTDSLKVFQ